MIQFDDLSKGFWLHNEYFPVIQRLNLTLPTGRSLALLGGNGAGKSTLLQLIAGTLPPDTGRVWSDGSISWPVGFAGSFHRDLTGAQNTRFLARVYGADTDELMDFVQDFAEIGKHFHMPIRTYSSGMRSRLTFGISMGIPFDTYLVDEVTAVGDARFRRKSAAVFRERILNSSAILVNHNLNELREYCDAAIVLHEGQLTFFSDLDEAVSRHQWNMR
ncbi:ABC transporter ATP-binding protein [Pararhodobacter aggregans]|uniref:ABC transporter ATP-binding protein n=1 Tax=Pararhodobacter aggregans TaxID=404875 RepID=A0A2T7UNW1_9RHOB|nr:ABC transporter ATP-binding protein [Pararhodobacter aggregans]PTX00808.1 capsular polysaccharide transport system ATP-binding protein [Pararhodobacter aggregans]PVE46336.1 ABC transporter ATP-binding protein [Pararhodobacter aggregans]